MRGAISYLDFDLAVRRTEGGYRAQVVSSPAGEATVEFKAPFTDLELENFVLRVGRPRRGTRRIGSPEMEAARTLGKGLYDAVFNGDVRACWHSSLSEAEAQNAGLRLRLRIADAPELSDIPWEYLYNASLNRFLSLSEFTPLIRYIDLPERIRPLVVNGRLEILTMISSPTGYSRLDVEHEWSRLNEALSGLIDRGQVRLERLGEARLSSLQRKLRGGEYHILHFIGHGGFDPGTQEGVLVLQDEAGKGLPVAAERLGTILHNHRSLRLIVLNACEGARSSRTDPFAGVAQTLVQQGIPAVIAMQFEITDAAAITFAEEFYAATADGYPVDAALSAARTAIFAAGNDIEWGTPVLYLRAPNGQLFSVNREGVQLAGPQQRLATAAPKESTRSRAAFSIEGLSKTMSNPKYKNDLSKLERSKYMSKSVISKETVIIVIGNRLPAELLDRPIAECLRDRIDERGEGNRFRRAIVLTDAAWAAEAPIIADNPVIAIGGPPANELSRGFSESAPTSPGEGMYTIRRVREVKGFFRRNSAGLPQVALWGKTAIGTQQAVEHYLHAENGLDEFLKMAWKTRDTASRRRR